MIFKLLDYPMAGDLAMYRILPESKEAINDLLKI